MSNQWKQGACACTDNMDVCMWTWCCPCFAYQEAADNIGENGMLYCLATFPFLCGCCALTVLGDNVAKKRGIESNIAASCAKACCDIFFCYSCTVVNESRLYKQEGTRGNSGVNGQKMQRN